MSYNQKPYAKHPNKRAMVEALERTGNITEAALAAKVRRKNHYDWLKKDPTYVDAVEAAMNVASDLLETEARRRAMEGVPEPVIRQDKDGTWKAVGAIRKYSDRLLIFLMKAARPEKYRERVDVNHAGSIGGRRELVVRFEDTGKNRPMPREDALNTAKKGGSNGTNGGAK